MESYQHKQARAPAALLLLGIISGLTLAKFTDFAPVPLFILGTFSAILSLLCAKRNFSKRWLSTFLLAALSTFAGYGELRFEKIPANQLLERPPREARLTIRIKRILQQSGPFEKISGIATIESVPSPIPLKTERMIYFNGPNNWIKSNIPLTNGTEIEATGILSPIQNSVKPKDEFNVYLKNIGIHYRIERLHNSRLVKLPNTFENFCSNQNQKFLKTLRLGENEDTNISNVYVAMLLGLKAELSAKQKKLYELSGTMHFFAISGLHIGVIAALIANALLLVRVPRAISPFIGLPLLFLFVYITGATPSAVRAFLMAAFFWASFAVNRQRSPLQALVGSAVFVLIFDPNQLWNVGFQLSYAVVLSILLYGLPLHQKLISLYEPFQWLPEADQNKFKKSIIWSYQNLTLLLSISLSAWLSSSILSAAIFGFYSPGAILLNIALVNLVGLTIISGILSITASICLFTALSTFINHAAWVTLSTMDFLIQTTSNIPGMVIHCPNFPTWLSYLGLIAYSISIILINRPAKMLNRFSFFIPPLITLTVLMIGTILYQ